MAPFKGNKLSGFFCNCIIIKQRHYTSHAIHLRKPEFKVIFLADATLSTHYGTVMKIYCSVCGREFPPGTLGRCVTCQGILAPASSDEAVRRLVPPQPGGVIAPCP